MFIFGNAWKVHFLWCIALRHILLCQCRLITSFQKDGEKQNIERRISPIHDSGFKKYISKINSQTPLNQVFKIAKKFLGRHTDTIRHVQKPDGTTAETQVDIANTIATSLAKNSSQANYNTTFQNIKTNREKQHLNFHSNNTETYNADFTIDELTSCISDLGDTAPGPDDIHNKIIRHLPSETLTLLLDIYNDMWRSHSFPESWRLATVIPIPKPNKDHTHPSNYRPIALTSCLCKLIEKMIHRRLMWFLETTGSLSGLQCGFRKTRSTLDHLVRLETFIREISTWSPSFST